MHKGSIDDLKVQDEFLFRVNNLKHCVDWLIHIKYLHTVLKALLAIYPSQLKTTAVYMYVSMFESVVFEVLDLHRFEPEQLFSSKLANIYLYFVSVNIHEY